MLNTSWTIRFVRVTKLVAPQVHSVSRRVGKGKGTSFRKKLHCTAVFFLESGNASAENRGQRTMLRKIKNNEHNCSERLQK